MKRSAALIEFSREHHTALVWAKRAQRPDADAASLAQELVAFFESALAPHFAAEERELLPRLRRHGEHALAGRLVAEHRALHADAERMRAGRADIAAHFGAALAAHVRFEERTLFPAIESMLSTPAAAPHRHAAACPPDPGGSGTADAVPPLAAARPTPRKETPMTPLAPDVYRDIVEQSADAMIFADVDGLIRLWNPAAEALFGFPAADAEGQSLDLIIPERLREPHWRGYREAMRAGRTKHAGRPTLTKALHRSGETIYVQMSFAAIVSADATVRGSLAIARAAAAPTK